MYSSKNWTANKLLFTRKMILTKGLIITNIIFTLLVSVNSESLISVVDVKDTLWHFGEMRSYRHPDGKARARAYVKSAFEELAAEYNTELEEHHFDTVYGGENRTGINYLWILPGTRYGQAGDKFTMLGAHYDSQVNTPGVNDDGSGMTAMIESARALVRNNFNGCEFVNSVGFVAFDWEEFALRGSDNFVYNYLVPIVLKRLDIQTKDFEGIVVFDTILNWDPRPYAMKVPAGFDLVFPEEYAIVEENEFAGDFLVVTNRLDDAAIGTAIRNIWERLPEPKFKLIYLEMQVEGRPISWPVKWLALKDLTRSDHQSFWNYADKDHRDGLKGVFLTDGANFRGDMELCYHNTCDDLDSVTDDVLMWLAKISEATTRYLLEVATEKYDVQCTGWADNWNFPPGSKASLFEVSQLTLLLSVILAMLF